MSLKPKQSITLILVNASQAKFQARILPIQDKIDSLILTAASRTQIDKQRLLNISTPTLKSSGLEFCCPAQYSVVESGVITSFRAYRSNSRYICAEITQTAKVITKDNKCRDVVATIICNLVNNDIQMALIVSNPASALHPDGKSDLGNPNSIDINAVNWIVIPRAEEQFLSVRSEPGAEWHLLDSTAVLHQASSGQESWSSPIHVNKHNKVTLPSRGYRHSINDELREEGEAASLCIRLTSDNHTDYITPTPHLFWQNFSSEATISINKTAISLLGASSSEAVELQPDEQKTHAL